MLPASVKRKNSFLNMESYEKYQNNTSKKAVHTYYRSPEIAVTWAKRCTFLTFNTLLFFFFVSGHKQM